jgi:hypothetical protein
VDDGRNWSKKFWALVTLSIRSFIEASLYGFDRRTRNISMRPQASSGKDLVQVTPGIAYQKYNTSPKKQIPLSPPSARETGPSPTNSQKRPFHQKRTDEKKKKKNRNNRRFRPSQSGGGSPLPPKGSISFLKRKSDLHPLRTLTLHKKADSATPPSARFRPLNHITPHELRLPFSERRNLKKVTVIFHRTRTCSSSDQKTKQTKDRPRSPKHIIEKNFFIVGGFRGRSFVLIFGRNWNTFGFK